MITIIAPAKEIYKAAKIACKMPEIKVKLISEGSQEHRNYEGDIFRKIQEEYYLEDIRCRIEDNYDVESSVLCGLTAEQVLNDKQLMENIYLRFEKDLCCGEDYWYLIDECTLGAIKAQKKENRK